MISYEEQAAAGLAAYGEDPKALLLAIESSCDETAAAVLQGGRRVLSMAVHTQIPLHRQYGGVVPELASRSHVERIGPVVEEALRRAEVSLSEIDALAVTCGPGLVGALLVGVSYAKGLALALGLPLVGVNHLAGHIAAKLAGGVAVLYVGAASEVEMKEKKDRVDDALHATRAAVEEGIVPGGGVALVRAKEAIQTVKVENKDEQTGVEIVLRAIEEPLRTIVNNAGGEGSVVVAKVEAGKGDFGFNAKTDEYVNMFQAGIIDPTKVTRVALENAASVAGMILTTEAAVVDIKEENPAPAAPMGGMGGMM